MGSNFWQCEQLRAGRVYDKLLFSTRGEAERFMRQMQRAQPDIFWRMASVPLAAVWN